MITKRYAARFVSRVLVAAAAGLCLLSALAVPARAVDQGLRGQSKVCVPFSATGIGQDVSDPAEVGVVRTRATISVRGYQVATTTAEFRITGGVAPIVRFAGPLVIDPRLVRGNITAQLVGSLDLSTAPTAAFSATSTTLTGDGQLAGVTGSIEIVGVQNLVDGSFTETLAGRLCAPRARQQALEHSVAGR